MPISFPASSTGKALKSCVSNSAPSSRSVRSCVTVSTARVMYCPALHSRKRYIAAPATRCASAASALRGETALISTSSVREQAAGSGFGHEVARDPAERPLAQARAPVGTGHDQVDVLVLDQAKQGVGRCHVGRPHPLGDDLDAVSGEIAGDLLGVLQGCAAVAG